MNILLRIILTVFTFLCMVGLVYFTFIAPNYLGETIEYSVEENGIIGISSSGKNVDTTSTEVAFFKESFSIANNVFYATGSFSIEDNIISVEPGIYFFDFNEINQKISIHHNNFHITPRGAGSFVLNVDNQRDVKIFNISGKIDLDLIHPSRQTVATSVELYPNMYYIGQPNEHRGLVNADLKKVSISSQFDSLSGKIYFHPILKDETGKAIVDEDTNQLQVDTSSLKLDTFLSKNIFDSNQKYENFIKIIYDFKAQEKKSLQEIFTQLSKKQYYTFPGEDYIQQYYDYFLNDEKKKYYYKNLILKKLISLSNGEGDISDRKYITEKLKDLQEISPEKYEEMKEVIIFYYKNILLSQKSNTNIVVDFSHLYNELHGKKYDFKYHSLINLHNIFEQKVFESPKNFNVKLNNFVDSYAKELNMNVFDGEHKKYTYFLYFIKNILLNESDNIDDYNSFVQIFETYVQISSEFIDKGDNIEVRTEIYNNIELIEIFTQIMRETFFEKQRNERNLLVINPQPKIDNKNYIILRDNLKILTDFYENNKYIVDSENTNLSAKAKQVVKKYKKNIDEHTEYFLAIENYTEYEFKYDDAIGNINFPGGETNSLSVEKAKEYLYQFQGAVTQTAEIKVRDFAYCNDPENGIDRGSDPYCYEIEKIEIDGIIFSFILIPSKKNQITYLSYINNENKTINSPNTHILDDIEENWSEKYKNSQSFDRDKYNFAKFFTNSYGNRQNYTNNNQDEQEELQLPTPPKVNETVAIQTLKRSLLSNDAPLSTIEDFMNVSYNYLIIERINNQYIARIFPNEFNTSYNTSGSKRNRIQGLFSGIYNYNSQNNHSFKNIELKIINHDNDDELEYLLGGSPVKLIGTVDLKKLKETIQGVGEDLQMMKYFYSEILARYENTSIIFKLDLETNDLILEYDNNKKVIINNQGQASKYIGDRKVIDQIRYSQIDL